MFENEVIKQNYEEIFLFWNTFCLWKANYIIIEHDIMAYVDWLESVLDNRISVMQKIQL